MAQILIIEDDVECREMLKDMFERNGYSVETAENGAQGVRMFRENPADLIITDMIMPKDKESPLTVSGGLQVMKDIKEIYPEIKFIAMSGGGIGDAKDFLEAAMLLNARYIFDKPFSNKELLQAVKELIG